MTITIGSLRFDHVDYDAEADVLYLSVGESRVPANSYGTPEGHNVRCDESGAVTGLTLVGPKELLERDGAIDVTFPSRVTADELASVL